jgi:hypothetical protein
MDCPLVMALRRALDLSTPVTRMTSFSVSAVQTGPQMVSFSSCTPVSISTIEGAANTIDTDIPPLIPFHLP